MDVHWNGAASVAVEVGTRVQPETASYSLPDQFLPGQTSEGGGDDANLEWLSMFMEECLSGTPSYDLITRNHPSPAPSTAIISAPPATATFISTSGQHYPPPATTFISASTQDYPPPVIPATFIPISSQHPPPPTTLNTGNLIPTWPIEQPSLTEHALTPKTKGKRSKHPPRPPSYPPLLFPTQWLADSELINHHDSKKANGEEEMKQRGQQSRRCSHCHSHKTPQWRTGPLGPKSLCNACGVRFKSGRLYPEYRPAKSPTFETFKHSNSHKRVMEMRMGLMSSGSK